MRGEQQLLSSAAAVATFLCRCFSLVCLCHHRNRHRSVVGAFSPSSDFSSPLRFTLLPPRRQPNSDRALLSLGVGRTRRSALRSSSDDDDTFVGLDMSKAPPTLHLDLERLLQMPTEDADEVLGLLELAVMEAGREAAAAATNSPNSSNDETVQTVLQLPPGVEMYRRFVTSSSSLNSDHDGRFAIFGGEQKHLALSLHPDVVFSFDDPLSFIRNILSTDSDKSYPPTEEAIIFLGTALEQQQEVKYCSAVLDNLPLAQVHAGAATRWNGDSAEGEGKGKGNAIVVPQPMAAQVRSLLYRHGLLIDEHEIMDEGTPILLPAIYRDIIRAMRAARRQQNDDEHDAISSSPEQTHSPSPVLHKTLCKLLDSAVAAAAASADMSQNEDNVGRRKRTEGDGAASSTTPPKPNHLVLVAYSSATADVAVALHSWKVNAMRRMSEEDVESLLHQAVTIVSIGSLSGNFPDGPAYLHLSMTDDVLVSNLGCSYQNNGGGGKGAVYLQASSPYYYRRSSSSNKSNSAIHEGYSMDSHNICACAIQLLAVLMRVNGTRSFRGLFDLASNAVESDIPTRHFAVASQKSCMDVPPNMEDELLPAMVRATGGFRWLWSPEIALGEEGLDGPASPIPSEDEADAILDWQYGYDAYQEIFASCSNYVVRDQ